MTETTARTTPPGGRLKAVAHAALGVGIALAFMHAFIPFDQFVHRGDDAFYYFKIAVNYPTYGFWTFDGINPTNGVQPLWALLLTAVAQVLHWIGVTDVHVLARVFVGIAALLHGASAVLLYRLLTRHVSFGTGVVAALGMLLPLGIVWSRVWGMENALYTTILLGTITFFHGRFLDKQTTATALLLGLLLGFTGLARLNAGLLGPCLALYYLVVVRTRPFSHRLRLMTLSGLAAVAVVLPYLAWNYTSTGHLLPVSGAVKAVLTEHYLIDRGIESRWSREFLSTVFWDWRRRIEWFLTSRSLDGIWVLGVRGVFDEAARAKTVLAALGAITIVPAFLGRPRAWFGLLGKRFQRLGRFWYVLLFGTINALLSILLYPTQQYAIIRWWLTENEIIVLVVTATLVVAALTHVADRLLSSSFRVRLATAGLAALTLWHAGIAVGYYWIEEPRIKRDWNQSWNDHSYRAAQWINTNLPPSTRVGSWNAGVLGYYADRPIINLDGLINSHELIPHIREREWTDYVRAKGITYLSDMDSKFAQVGIRETLPLTEVYKAWSPLMGQPYIIYRVDLGPEPGQANGSALSEGVAGTADPRRPTGGSAP